MLASIYRTKEEILLKSSIKNLGLKLPQNPYLSPLVDKVFKELEKKGFSAFRPHIYLGDEWFSPEGEAAVSIPFYLAHPKLTRLEKKHTGEAEGENKKIFLALLRHEIGHCFDHTYKLSKRQDWKRFFGDPQKKIYNPDSYDFDPKSKDFVINLEDHYAQAHPDEDFAETFAVWLEKKKETWMKEYQTSPKALKKLLYLDHLMSNLRDREAKISPKSLIYRADKLRISLESYYNRKRKQLKAH